MMRLIDADALCRSLSEWQFGSFATVGHEKEYDLLDEVLTGVSAAPTIDAVPVVRCADCKWFEPLPNRPDGKGFCHIWGALDEPRYNVKSGYCSYGRRKDGYVLEVLNEN